MYDIRLVKLVNGEMVLGKWDQEAGVIRDPAVLQTIPTAQGGVQMLLLPFGYPPDGRRCNGCLLVWQYSESDRK